MADATPDTDSKIQIVGELLSAYAAGDSGVFARHLADDVVFRPSAFVSGVAEYRGREAARRGLASSSENLRQQGKQVRISTSATFGDRADAALILTLAWIEIFRESGEHFGNPIAYLWRFQGRRVIRLTTWLDHSMALGELSSPVSVADRSRGPVRLAVRRGDEPSLPH